LSHELILRISQC